MLWVNLTFNSERSQNPTKLKIFCKYSESIDTKKKIKNITMKVTKKKEKSLSFNKLFFIEVIIV